MESAPARVLKVRGIYPLVIEETRSRLGVASVGELVDSDLSLFGQFLTALAGSRIAMFEKYGSTYCKKIAYEHTQAEDRSQRFNYKRRLIQCKILCPEVSGSLMIYSPHICRFKFRGLLKLFSGAEIFSIV